MTQLNLTPAATAPALTDLSGLSGTDAADLSAVTDPGTADLSHPTSPSDVDEHDRGRPGPSLGGLPGGSPVRETPSEPPPTNHPTAQVNPPDSPIRDRGD